MIYIEQWVIKKKREVAIICSVIWGTGLRISEALKSYEIGGVISDENLIITAGKGNKIKADIYSSGSKKSTYKNIQKLVLTLILTMNHNVSLWEWEKKNCEELTLLIACRK